MNETYHLRIQEANGQEAVLAFPGCIASRVEKIFQEQYQTGSDFVRALEDSKQELLEAIAAAYPSERKTFSYSIEEDRLVLKPVASIVRGGAVKASHSQNEAMSMIVMAMFLGNYLHIRRLFESDRGPLTLRKTFDIEIDQSYMDMGKAPSDEWLAIFEGKEPHGAERKYIKLEPTVISPN